MLRALLKGRTMQVVYNNLISLIHELTAGVAQGSVLAPLLFLIFIHALTTRVSSRICQSLFADDIALLPVISHTAGLVNLGFALDVLSHKRKHKYYSSHQTNEQNNIYNHTHSLSLASPLQQHAFTHILV